jgi:hypothetical protein
VGGKGVVFAQVGRRIKVFPYFTGYSGLIPYYIMIIIG